MENDRELLELAAKAAGHQIVGWNEQHGVDVAVMKDGSFWQPLLENPITDCMGDALRLAVKLSFCHTQWFNHDPPDVMIGYKTPDGKGHNWIEDHNGDPEAATRLAITRAAAEVGRAME